MTLQIVLASGNAHKREELQAALAEPVGGGAPRIELVVLEDPPAPDETGDDFVDNALIKAHAWLGAAGRPVLADDSGLEVDALHGAPGVFSSRFAADRVAAPRDVDNNAKLLDLLAGAPRPWTARFRCVLVLLVPNGALADALRVADAIPGVQRRERDGCLAVIASGATEGQIVEAARGRAGFGYDPLFLSDDLGITFAEASLEQKQTVSHRGRAVAQLAAVLRAALR